MADYFVASGGSNTAPYDTWAKAATSLQTALTAASANGDRVIIQYDAVPSGDTEVAADTIYTTTASRYTQIISASNDGGSAFTPTAMGTANWIGNSTTNRSITLGASNDSRVYVYGLTIRTAGSTLDFINLGTASGAALVLDGCYLWMGNTSTTALFLGNNAGTCCNVHIKNTTLRFGATSNVIQSGVGGGNTLFENCTISSAGSAPSVLCTRGNVTFVGCDLSHVTGTLVGNILFPDVHVFQQCKLGSGVTVLATQTGNPTASSASAYVFDCASGDTHGLFGYYDALGSVASDTGIYYTSGAAAQSWKIVTTANATFLNPFKTPWINFYNAGTSAITPYLEILRDGSTTAYQDDEVWAEFSAKTTTGSTQASFSTDRMAVAGTPANQDAGAGLGSWTGEGGTAWSGKVDSGSALTPAEAGDIRGRVVVGEPSITVYVDPYIRT